MDFESLIGPSAYLARQLELRWFYQWEIPQPPGCQGRYHESAIMESSSSNASEMNCTPSSEVATGNHCSAYNGRLVRKRHHSMPFLRIRRSRRSFRRRSTKNARVDGSSAREVVATNNNGELIVARAGGRPERTSLTKSCDDYGGGGKRPRSRTSSSPMLSSEFQSYVEDPTARQRVMDKLPKEIHHDEVFVLERMKESWLDNPQRAESREIAQSDETNGPRDKRCDSIERSRSSLDHSSCMLLTNHANSNAHKLLPPDAGFPGPYETDDTPRIKSNTGRRRPHLPPAYFHYLHMQPNNVPATIVEEIDGRFCPFCSFDGKSNEGLLEHCGAYHGAMHETNKSHNGAITLGEDGGCSTFFEAVMGEEGQLHVIVRVVPLSTPDSHRVRHRDFMFIQPKRKRELPKNRVAAFEMNGNRRDKRRSDELISANGSHTSSERLMTIPFLQRRPDIAKTLDAGTRNKRLLALQAGNAPASIISAYLPSDAVPIRQYFHSRTNLPMSHGEWMVDSDDEIDETWLSDMSSELLDELEDVTAREKQFMKLWNRFIKSNHIIADKDVPLKCHEFVLIHRNQLNAGLRLNFLLHLFNLWDSGVISSNRISHCMSMLDSAKHRDNEAVGQGLIMARPSKNLANGS